MGATGGVKCLRLPHISGVRWGSAPAGCMHLPLRIRYSEHFSLDIHTYSFQINTTTYIPPIRIVQYELRRGGEILYKRDFGSSSSGGHNSFDRMASREAPVEIGKQYDVKIEEIARQGDGIARIEGFVIFVPSTQINDELKIEIKAVKRTCAIGEAV